MKRIELQASKLSLTIDRIEDCDNERYVDLVAYRDELVILNCEVYWGTLLRSRNARFGELTPAEHHQINAALVAEWLDWKPSDIGDSMASETILDVFARLKKSLEDKGLVAGGEAAE